MKLLCGVGVNDVPNSAKVGFVEPSYTKWSSMIKRCYDGNNTCYENTYVCEDWLIFSKFKAWMETQDWKGKQLDKDLLLPGNKVYSPETCVFVSPEVNKFIVEQKKKNSNLPVGVCFARGKYKAQIHANGKTENIGFYDTPEQAHHLWKKRKYELALELAGRQTNPLVANALIEKYKNYEWKVS